MNKKFISIAMAMILAVSTSAIAASAAEVEVEPSGNTGTIFFDSGDWNSSKIYFYIWDTTDNTYCTKNGWVDTNPWGSKKIAGTAVEGEDGKFESYEIEFKDDHDLYVIFFDPNSSAQTYDCVLNSSAMGDTAYMTGNVIENPVDSEKTCIEARFQNADCGPKLAITSSGNIVGEYITPNMDCPKQVADFVYKYLGQQEKITGADIVTEETVANAISAFQTTADDVWAKFQSFEGQEGYEEYANKVDGAKSMIKPTSAEETDTEAADTDSATNSDDDDDDDTTNNTSSKSSTTNTTSKSSTTTSKSTTTTSAVDSAATGDTTGTMAFVAVLFAAAAAIVVTRKKVQE